MVTRLKGLLISAPMAIGVCYFFVVDSVSPSVCLCVTVLLQIASSFLLVLCLAVLLYCSCCCTFSLLVY